MYKKVGNHMKNIIKIGNKIRVIKKESLFYNQILTVCDAAHDLIFVRKPSGLPLIYTQKDVELVYDDNKNKFEPGQVIKVIKATSRQKGKYGKIVRIKYNKRNTLYIVEFETGYKRTYTAWEIQAVDNTDHQTCRCR